MKEVSATTNIPEIYLTCRRSDVTASVAQRMSWASKRQTTRVEDQAYSLLGMFDVNMPLLYGEGSKAFVRLQEEILKRSRDQSVLAWRAPSRFAWSIKRNPLAADDDFNVPGIVEESGRSMLAPSPSWFEDCGDVEFHAREELSPSEPLLVTSEGLEMKIDLTQAIVKRRPPHTGRVNPTATQFYAFRLSSKRRSPGRQFYESSGEIIPGWYKGIPYVYLLLSPLATIKENSEEGQYFLRVHADDLGERATIPDSDKKMRTRVFVPWVKDLDEDSSFG